MSSPFFSVIVPVRDGGDAFRSCLDALSRSPFADRELIVVDDGSRDGSVACARAAGATLLRTEGGCGPAAARNLGACHARGRFLLFLDADCAIEPEALGRLAEALRTDPRPTAVFGSYDDAPPAPGFVAQYKNLVHHYVHQHGRADASTFWAGCGAVRRSVFLEIGGFDEVRYPRPSIEDIELGHRLRRRGHRIRLAGDVQVKHHKAWSLFDLVRTDVLRRAVPWTELILSSREMPDDLNLRVEDRLSVLSSWLLLALLSGTAWEPAFLYAAPAPIAVLVGANRDLYGFFLRKRGRWFAARAMALHAFYFLYSGAAFLIGAARYVLRHRGTRLPDDERAPLELPERNGAVDGGVGQEA